MLNKNRRTVATCITPFDLHDIARSALTYGIKRYYVVNPFPAQVTFAKRFTDFWESSAGAKYNITRTEAFERLVIKEDLDAVVRDIGHCRLVATTARKRKGQISFKELRRRIKGKKKERFLILLGTGWGMTEEVFARADMVLEPIKGAGKYNHLSVRGAAAVILDRLLGKN